METSVFCYARKSKLMHTQCAWTFRNRVTGKCGELIDFVIVWYINWLAVVECGNGCISLWWRRRYLEKVYQFLIIKHQLLEFEVGECWKINFSLLIRQLHTRLAVSATPRVSSIHSPFPVLPFRFYYLGLGNVLWLGVVWSWRPHRGETRFKNKTFWEVFFI